MCETDRDDDPAAGDGHRPGDGAEAPASDPGAWCAIGNVRREIPYGPGGAEIRSGLRKFKAGAKLHVVGAYRGTCEHILVVGQHRHDGKYVRCVIRASAVENLRPRVVHSPSVLRLMREDRPDGVWMPADREEVESLVELVPRWVGFQERGSS